MAIPRFPLLASACIALIFSMLPDNAAAQPQSDRKQAPAPTGAAQRVGTAVAPVAAPRGTPIATFNGALRGYQDATHVVRLDAGQLYHVTLSSNTFDTELTVEGPEEFLVENQDQYGYAGTRPRDYTTDIHDSGLYLVAPVSGLYRLTVSKQEEAEAGGAYTLNVLQMPVIQVGQAYAGDLTAGDAKNLSGSFAQVFAIRGRAGDRLSLRYSSDDFDTYVIVYAPNDMGEGERGDYDFVLPLSGTYRVEVSTFRPGDRGRYLLQVGNGLQPASQGPIAAASVPLAHSASDLPQANACSATLTDLGARRVRIAPRDGQLAELMLKIAQAHVCLGELEAADLAFSEAIAASMNSPYGVDAQISRIALAEMTGAYAKAEQLRLAYDGFRGIGPKSWELNLQDYGRADYIIDPVDNLELLTFASMIEVLRDDPQYGVPILAARQQTVAATGRTVLAAQMTSMLARFSSQGLGDADCNTLLYLGVSYSTSGEARAGAGLLKRALAEGRRHDHFECGARRDGSGDSIEERDVVRSLASAHALAEEADAGIALLREWVGKTNSHVVAADLAALIEGKGDRGVALTAWRDAMRMGEGRFRKFEGGSIHVLAADAFLRLGAPADAAHAFEGIARIMDQSIDEAYRQEFEPSIAYLYASAALSERLALKDVTAAMGCPQGRASIDVSRYKIPTPASVTYADRAYFEYCRAWAATAGTLEARQTTGRLLSHAEKAGWGGEEVRALVEQTLDAMWESQGGSSP